MISVLASLSIESSSNLSILPVYINRISILQIDINETKLAMASFRKRKRCNTTTFDQLSSITSPTETGSRATVHGIVTFSPMAKRMF